MSYVVLDFETYYDQQYSLKNMTPVEYILDDRFEVLGAGVVDHAIIDRPFWMDGDALKRYLEGLKERGQFTVVSHNSLFDACILAWHYGVVPNLLVDTLGMCRAMIGAYVPDVRLETVAAHLGLGEKGKVLAKTKGMHRPEIEAAGLWDDFKAYAMFDAELCERIFRKLAPSFPKEEYKIMDMVLRCAVEPKFVLDRDILLKHLAEIKQEKAALLTRAGILDKRDLLSNEKFAEALRRLGIEPPLKTSPATGKPTYAFAKNDPDMVQLADHPRQDVQALVAARVGTKSTLEETRTERLIAISNLDWGKSKLRPAHDGLPFAPIPLRYSGAHTHRLSGDWALNAQNWTKAKVMPDGTKETGRLRLAHRAPPGHLVVKCDASQIEARIVAWLSGQQDLSDDFRNGVDIYSKFATENIYHYPVGKHTEDERFVGKNAILGLGFQVGAPKFKKELAAKSFTTLGRSIIIPIEEAQMIVGAYRQRYPFIPMAWQYCGDGIKLMAGWQDKAHTLGPVKFGPGHIMLPNGLALHYPDLKWDASINQWVYKHAKERRTLFGGKVWENIVQALARIITMNAALKMQSIYPLAHQVHDDLVYIVPEQRAEEFATLLQHEMSKSRSWYSDLPLAAETGIGPSYGEAK
jgi:hypothetical protein